jgi:carbonic anhydrase
MAYRYTRTGKPDSAISNIFEANQRWKFGKLGEDPEFFDKLGSGHAPKYLWIGKA